MENWRTFLTESESGGLNPKIEEIADEMFDINDWKGWTVYKVVVEQLQDENGVGVKLIWDGPGRPHGPVEVGHVNISDHYEDRCFPDKMVWVVTHSKMGDATDDIKGWGPLLYEVAIEWASKYDGLMPDRSTVSKDARRVWQKYFERSDLNKEPIDLDPNEIGDMKGPDSNGRIQYFSDSNAWVDVEQLTPNEPDDDCDVSSSFNNDSWSSKSSSEVEGTKWSEDPVGYIYSKRSQPTIKYLADNGLFEDKTQQL